MASASDLGPGMWGGNNLGWGLRAENAEVLCSSYHRWWQGWRCLFLDVLGWTEVAMLVDVAVHMTWAF